MLLLRSILNLVWRERQYDFIAINLSVSELIETFGDQAYYEARDREKGRILDGEHPASH